MTGLGRYASLLISLVALLGSGCVSPATEDDGVSLRQRCSTLRDHVIELRLQDATGIDADLAAHRTAMKQALGPGFIEQCASGFSEAQVACALGATDMHGVSSCASGAMPPVAATR